MVDVTHPQPAQAPLTRDQATAYSALASFFRGISGLRHVEAIAAWDEATMMPEGSSNARAEALSALRGLIHEQLGRADVADWFSTSDQQAEQLLPWEKANLREMRRAWLQAVAVPRDLVEAASLAESHCEQAWRKLRPANNFSDFLPLLREVVRLKREVARHLGERLSMAPYDALLESFQPGLHQQHIAPLFARLRKVLPGLIGQAMTRQEKEIAPARQVQALRFPVEKQRKLVVEVMRRLGFDFGRGRLDTTHHPFCGGVAEDVRIAIRYHEDDFLPALAGVIHESGHGKYEQRLPAKWLGQPVAQARGACIHESQSLLHEMQVGRSEAFLTFIAPIVADALGTPEDSGSAAFSAGELRRRLTRVTPSLVRVDADELTYPCHIILRFELEKGLFDGSLQVDDIPAAWDAGMRDLLGISTKGNDRDGCMQDVHWPAGLFGYFPSYLLGSLFAAQLFGAAKGALPNLMDDIRRGAFDRLDSWLEKQIWGNGSFLDTTQLIEDSTGAPLGTEAFEAHVKSRYVLGES